MKMIPNGYKCTSHVLKVPTAEVMRVAKQADTTPAAILVPLFCRALRHHLPKKIRNRNVSCNIVVDCRKQMQLETMRNFYYGKVITYQDRFDAYDLPMLATAYRDILDLFVQPENIIRTCSDQKDATDFLFHIQPLALQRVVVKAVARIIKHRILTYVTVDSDFLVP